MRESDEGVITTWYVSEVGVEYADGRTEVDQGVPYKRRTYCADCAPYYLAVVQEHGELEEDDEDEEPAVMNRDPFDPAYINSGSDQDKRLAKIFTSALTRDTGEPTQVRIVDRFAYVWKESGHEIVRCLVPAAAYDQLARWQEYGMEEGENPQIWLEAVPPELREEDYDEGE